MGQTGFNTARFSPTVRGARNWPELTSFVATRSTLDREFDDDEFDREIGARKVASYSDGTLVILRLPGIKGGLASSWRSVTSGRRGATRNPDLISRRFQMQEANCNDLRSIIALKVRVRWVVDVLLTSTLTFTLFGTRFRPEPMRIRWNNENTRRCHETMSVSLKIEFV